MISVIIPSFNEMENIKRTAEVLSTILEKNGIEYELLFINDGSKDETWQRILECSKENIAVKGVSLSRNFGKEACIFAGLRNSQGECCVVIDCDLQHPPETILEMYRFWQQGYEVVEGVKRSRGKENLAYKASAGLFYKAISHFVGIDMEASSDFKLLDRSVVDVLCKLPEKSTFFRALSFWVGFKTITVEYDVAPREFGVTKWSFAKLFKYAINNITSFTAAPLQIVTVLGGILIVLDIILAIQTLVRWSMNGAVEGFTTVILLLLLVGGCIMVSLGIIGYYLSRMYDELKGRPQYIISSKVNIDKVSNRR